MIIKSKGSPFNIISFIFSRREFFNYKLAANSFSFERASSSGSS